MENINSMNDLVEMPESIADITLIVKKMKEITNEWAEKTPDAEEEMKKSIEIATMLNRLVVEEENQEEFNNVASKFLEYVRSESLIEVIKKKMKLEEETIEDDNLPL